MDSKRFPTLWVLTLTVGFLGPFHLILYLWATLSNKPYTEGATWLFGLGLTLVLVLAGGYVVGAYLLLSRVRKTTLAMEMVLWTFAGLLAVLSLTFWPIFYQITVGVTVEDPSPLLIISSALGGNAGFVAGFHRARAKQRFTEVLDARNSLSFLNKSLRHNVLNSINIIQGFTDLIAEEIDPDNDQYIRVIQQQSEHIVNLVRNTRILIMLAEEPTQDFGPVNVKDIVLTEIDTLESNFETVVVETDIATSQQIMADDYVSVLVSNILTNAVIHNDQSEPKVEVTLSEAEDSVVLSISDNGPGIPEGRKSEIHDPGPHGEYGLGLFLVRKLISRYGGGITIELNFAYL